MKEGISMKICSIHIAGFGKWQNYDLADLSNLQFIYGENEAGKSTIIAFIHSILFGFPSNKGQGKSFEPIAGQVYGGFLILEHPTEGKVKIERLKQGGVQQLTVLFENGREAGEEALTHLLNGMNKQQYLSIFSFDLFGIQGVHQISEEDLNRYFLTIGMTGSDYYLQVADGFLKKGEQLYKPKGRNPELNQQAIQLRKMKQQLQVGKEKNEQYMLLFKQKVESNEKIKKRQLHLQQLNQQLFEIKDLEDYWEAYQEYRQLNESFALSEPFFIDAHDVENYQQYQQQLQNISAQLGHLKEQEIAISEKMNGEQVIDQSLVDPLQRKVEEWPLMNQKLEEIHEKQQRVSYLTNEMAKQAYEADLSDYQQSANVTLTQDSLKQIREMNDQSKVYQQQSEILLLKQQQNFEKSYTLQEQMTRIESQLVSKKQLTIWQEQFEKNDSGLKLRTVENKRQHQKNSRRKQLAYVGLGLSVMLFIVALICLTGIVKYGSLFILVMAALMSGFHLLKLKQVTTKVADDVTLNQETYQHQLAERERYRILTVQLDEIQAEGELLASQIAQLMQEKTDIETAFKQLKANLVLPEELTNEALEEKVTILIQLQHLAMEQGEMKAQIQKNEKLVNQWINQCEILTEPLALDWSQPTASIEKLRYLLERQKEAQFSMVGKNRQQAQILKQRKDLEVEKEQLVQRIATLFEKGNVQNEADFLDEQKRLMINEEQVKRYQLLTQQLQTRLPRLKDFQSLEFVKQKIAVTENDIEVCQQQLNHQLNEKAQLKVELQQLEEGKYYTQMLQQYGNQKEQFQEKAKVWLRYQVATHMIERTLAFAQQDQLPKTLRVAEQLMHQLTNGKYQKITFKDERLMLQDDVSNHWRAVDLSQGTSEQLYLALRLAFIINLSQNLQLPIIIDDAFVHFDQRRKAAAFDLLLELSKDHQIFYFSCQKENSFYFDRENQITLSV